MERKIVGISGRGFAGADAPGVSVSVTGTELVASSAYRERVGDVHWALPEPILWPSGGVGGFGEGKQEWNVDNDEEDDTSRSPVRIRVAGVGVVKTTVEEWVPVGPTERNLFVKVVAKNFESSASEHERSKRRMRLQKNQIQLELMRGMSPQSYIQWEEKRQNNAAKTIQSFFINSLSRYNEQHRGQWRDSFVNKSSREKKKKAGAKWKHHSIEDTRRRFLQKIEAEAMAGDNEADEMHEDEDIEQGDNQESREDEDEGKRETAEEHDAFFKRMQEIDNALSKEALTTLQSGGRISAHENYQFLIEQSRQVASRWRQFDFEDSRATVAERARTQRLRKCDLLSNKLGKLQDPLSHQIESQGAKYWTLPRDKHVLEEAKAKHVATLENHTPGKEWWRVRVGYEDCDIRTKKAQRPPWRYPYNVVDELSNEEDMDLSRWWISFASKDSSTADLVLGSSQEDTVSAEAFDEVVKREADRLVNDVERKLKSLESPILQAALSCPPHRLYKIKGLLERARGPNQKASPRHTRHPGLWQRPASPGSPRSTRSSTRHQQQAEEESLTPFRNLQVSMNNEEERREDDENEFSLNSSGDVRKGKRGKRKKKTSGKKKERAMAAHIEALEEQVAILRSQVAKRELDELKASLRETRE